MFFLAILLRNSTLNHFLITANILTFTINSAVSVNEIAGWMDVFFSGLWMSRTVDFFVYCLSCQRVTKNISYVITSSTQTQGILYEGISLVTEMVTVQGQGPRSIFKCRADSKQPKVPNVIHVAKTEQKPLKDKSYILKMLRSENATFIVC